jgi:undecaprenyl diphosphate synthase
MDSKFSSFEGVFTPASREAGLLRQLDPRRLPRHIAVIMDGNGRWAQQRQLPRVEGHRAGAESVKATVETCARLGIEVLTLYAFSAENWKRPASEVRTLMGLLKQYVRNELSTIQQHDIRFRPIGRVGELSVSVQRALRRAERATRGNQGMALIIALNYSGRLELVDAVSSLIAEGAAAPVTEQDIQNHLYTRGLPDPDLLIRTSGEIRVSNFLLWQIAYSEIYVTDVLWPDFRAANLLEAVLSFQSRERRYGGIRPALPGVAR